jgi:hypothetical protein
MRFCHPQLRVTEAYRRQASENKYRRSKLGANITPNFGAPFFANRESTAMNHGSKIEPAKEEK